MKQRYSAKTYCDWNSFARRATGFALRVRRRTRSIAETVATVVLLSVSAGMQLQWYSSFGTSTKLEIGAIKRPTRQLYQVMNTIEEGQLMVSILPFVRPRNGNGSRQAVTNRVNSTRLSTEWRLECPLKRRDQVQE